MTTIAFDTYKLIMKLRSRGFSEEQAAGINEAIMEIDVSSLASKADLQEVKSELSAEIQGVKSELSAEIQGVKSELSAEIHAIKSDVKSLKGEMRELELRLIVRIGTMMFVGFGFLAAIKFFNN